MGRLILMFKDTILNTYPLAQDQCITIGRHQSNDIIIDNLAVSGYHARIDAKAGVFLISDLQSKNGTYINNERITESQLHQKDRICIGKHNLTVDLLDEIDVADAVAEGAAHRTGPSAISDEQTMVLDTSLGRQLRGEAPNPNDTIAEPFAADKDSLFFLEGGEGELELTQQQITIGKNSDADIVVTGLRAFLVGTPAATITKQTGDYLLRFVGGLTKPKRNGTSIKGTVKLRSDDIIEVGPVKLQVKLNQGTCSRLPA
jgi:pSer/pThr/pTyr-binding forkhead associated (FHA) protein